jgi:hypothetical protein
MSKSYASRHKNPFFLFKSASYPIPSDTLTPPPERCALQIAVNQANSFANCKKTAALCNFEAFLLAGTLKLPSKNPITS